MPEGDSIFRTARALNRALGDRVVTGFETTLAPLARVNDDAPLVGRTVERVEARGKWCVIFFSGDLILLTHMRMSGSWHIYRVGERWQAPHSAMRIVITCGDVQAVGFSIPVAEFHTARSLERSAHMSELGLDVLGATYRVDEAAQALREYGRAHPDAEIGNVLMNQRVIAGIGNIYKSEIAVCGASESVPAHADDQRSRTRPHRRNCTTLHAGECRGKKERGHRDIYRHSRQEECDGPRCATVGIPPAGAGVPALRSDHRDAKAGNRCAVDLLVSIVPAVD